MLESAPNALNKGQAQYLTPPALAMEVAQALPRHRPTIVDLNCGYGDLLQGARNHSTIHLLGSDIDPCRKSGLLAEGAAPVSRITADLTLLYPLLCEVNWRADLFVLNPPWDLHWHKERLKGLGANTELRFDELIDVVDPRVGAAQIDSTIATLMIALDRCTYAGEGLLIANHATIERLIYARHAPYAPLQERIWARRVIPGNPMTGRAPAADPTEASHGNQSVEVLYFGRNSDYAAASPVETVSRAYRYGPSIRDSHQCHTQSVPLWRAVAEEWRDRSAAAPPRFNISLSAEGKIRTHLSTFNQHTGKLDKELVAKLFELNGQRPMQLVQQRATRQALLGTLKLWNVAPELNAAVAQALSDYNAIRAPLYPLPEIQRLGYLEEEDTIACKAAFVIDNITFKAGERYPIRSETLPIERHVWRCNLSGEDEDILLTGKELVFYIGQPETEVAFLLNPPLATQITGPRLPLTALVEHFIIPEVPDVASTNPAQYQINLDKLTELESAFPAQHSIKLKQRQREDIARAGCHDGDVLAWEPGLGKTMAGFLFALVKVGYTIKK